MGSIAQTGKSMEELRLRESAGRIYRNGWLGMEGGLFELDFLHELQDRVRSFAGLLLQN